MNIRKTFAAWRPAGLLCIFLFVSAPVLAGPPFRTDDPEPVAYRSGEFYVGHAYANNEDGISGTAPHFEINYGLVPNLQLHVLMPFAFSQPHGDKTRYGIGDLELGAKYRFLEETNVRPQMGTFPLVHLPTGNADRGLGNGEAQVFIPLWLQKSWGPFQTYGGGGYWINPGTDNENFWFFGWEVQWRLNDRLTMGGEICHQTPSVREGEYETGYNAGAIIDFTASHHFLLSAGADIRGPNLFSYYLAYQYTWGPPPKEEKKVEKQR